MNRCVQLSTLRTPAPGRALWAPALPRTGPVHGKTTCVLGQIRPLSVGSLLFVLQHLLNIPSEGFLSQPGWAGQPGLVEATRRGQSHPTARALGKLVCPAWQPCLGRACHPAPDPEGRDTRSPLAKPNWGLSSHHQAGQPLKGGQRADRDPAPLAGPCFPGGVGSAWAGSPRCGPALHRPFGPGAPGSLGPSFSSDEGQASFWGFS